MKYQDSEDSDSACEGQEIIFLFSYLLPKAGTLFAHLAVESSLLQAILFFTGSGEKNNLR